jgi:cellulose synthase/poly-beta-1,6-N-acetylglucosamine synthase-like glycosyltransferase
MSRTKTPRFTYSYVPPLKLLEARVKIPPKPKPRPLLTARAKTTAKTPISTKKPAPRVYMRKMALLIAAHDEELVLERTIRSAIRAGMKKRDIYVVDDNSSDTTSKLARAILGKENVCKVRRSGKGLALTKGAAKFRLTERYQWIHIADADGAFARDYFHVFRRNLRPKYAVATGYIKSMPGKSISQYRVYEYTIGMELHRRFQTLTQTVPIIPGPTSCFRSDIFAQLDFTVKALTEDFDVTLQLHRRKLGKVQFIPGAVAYTQDPQNVNDFVKQITRWNRGIMQGSHRHHIGFKTQRIDAYLSYQIIQNLVFFINYALVMPYIAFRRHSPALIASLFLFDVITTLILTSVVSLRSRRWDILSAFPQIYILRWLTLFVFLKAFAEVTILRRFRITDATWSTEGRRYKPTLAT